MTTQELIERYIILNIQTGKWLVGYKLFSERQFAIKFQTTTSTVRKVLTKLSKANIIVSNKNIGHFVKENNFLLPSDNFGLKNNFYYLSKMWKLNKNNEIEKIVLWFEKTFQITCQELSFFKKIVYHKNKIVKSVIIGIDKKSYELNNKIYSETTIDGLFSPRKFMAYTNQLIYSREDIIVNNMDKINMLCDELETDKIISFQSKTCDKNNILLELAISAVDYQMFSFRFASKIN